MIDDHDATLHHTVDIVLSLWRHALKHGLTPWQQSRFDKAYAFSQEALRDIDEQTALCI